MGPQTTSPLRPGQVFEIGFPAFTPRITIHSERELTVEIVAGDNEGFRFRDTVAYEAVAVRDGLVILTWQEHIGSTIVHVLDFVSGEAYTAVTPAKGGFMRLRGRIDVKPRSTASGQSASRCLALAHDIPVVSAAGLQQGHPGAVPLLAHSGAGFWRAGSQDRKASRRTRAGRYVTSGSPQAP
jgi:hypothetical protein